MATAKKKAGGEKNTTSSKVTKVALKQIGNNVIEKFEINHALRILKLVNKRWKLAEDGYVFDGLEIKKKA